MTDTFQLGAWSCRVFSDGVTEVPLDGFLENADLDDPILSAYGLTDNRLPLALNVLYIDTGTHRILVDSGLGRDAGNGEGQLPGQLAVAGIAPETIDTILITHGHWDHIGGLLTPEGDLRFPNAHYWMWALEQDFWMNNAALTQIGGEMEAVARAVMPRIEDRMTLIKAESEILPGVAAVRTPGHTIGQIGFLFESYREPLLHMADALHHPVQVARPEWTSSADLMPETMAATRRRLFDIALTTEALVMGYHFPFPGLGRIVPGESGYGFQPV